MSPANNVPSNSGKKSTQAGAAGQRPKPALSARERLAEERRQAEAAAARKRMIGVGALAAVVLLVIVGIFAAIGLNKGGTTNPAPSAGEAYVKTLTSVPAATLDAVGAGSAKNVVKAIDGGQPAMKDGKPRVLYVGAEFCPYCGVERWPLTIALSRFGTFDGLKAGLSSPNEGQISNIPTVTYVGSKYTSQYLTFDAVETADRMGNKLQSVQPADQTILDKYDPGTSGNPIPFLYWGTGFQPGASYGGAQFMPGKSGDAIAAKLSDPQSSEAQQILGAANVHTAQLCKLTNGQPGDVCTSAGVQAAAKVLG